VVKEIIIFSTSDALALKVFYFSSEKGRNTIFDNWEFVDVTDLNQAHVTRLKARYFVGGNESIYAPPRTFRERQGLIWWARINDEEGKDVREYLEDEFERRPASISKHISWLVPSIGTEAGLRLVDDLFPLHKLASLAKKHGSKPYSNDDEKRAVVTLMKEHSHSLKLKPEVLTSVETSETTPKEVSQ
jgi:hypothetical protein